MTVELWKSVPSRPGYFASSLGRVKGPRRTLTPHPNRNGGYPMVNARGTAYVHTLVAEAFLGPRPPGHDVAHKDHDRQNSRPSNLKYQPHAQNVADTKAAGRQARGEGIHGAKLTAGQVAEIRALHRPRTFGIGRLAAQFGVGRTTIGHIIHGRTWIAALTTDQEGR